MGSPQRKKASPSLSAAHTEMDAPLASTSTVGSTSTHPLNGIKHPSPELELEPPPVAGQEQEEEEEEEDPELLAAWTLFDEFSDQYHDMVVELPLSYFRTFALLTDLETAHQSALVRLSDGVKDLVALAKNKASRRGGDPVEMDHERRGKLDKVAKEAREMMRAAEEKVGLAVSLYEQVDRQIQALDASLLHAEDSLVIGLRAGTLPSHDAPAYAPKSPPGRTTGLGARMVDGDVETRIRGTGTPRGRKGGRKGKKENAIEDDVDPNGPTYCFCERVSFGEMIGCENEDCTGEWFHLSCVGLDAPPDGTWYCSECVQLLGVDNKSDRKGKRKADQESPDQAKNGDNRKKRKRGKWG